MDFFKALSKLVDSSVAKRSHVTSMYGISFVVSRKGGGGISLFAVIVLNSYVFFALVLCGV